LKYIIAPPSVSFDDREFCRLPPNPRKRSNALGVNDMMQDRWFTMMIVGLGILTVAMAAAVLFLTDFEHGRPPDQFPSATHR
jgi:hypothetical protein